MEDYTIRLLTTRAEAEGVAALVWKVYGSHYSYHEELYDPDLVLQQNREGRTISTIAVDAAGKVVGHCGIMRPGLEAVAETGESMVDADHRAHHLMHRMRELLYEEAGRRGIAALHGTPVTNHVRSQKVYEAFGSRPVGILLGGLSRSFENLGMPLEQRLSGILHFKFLTPPLPTSVHLPPRHQEILERTCAQFQAPLEAHPPGPLAGEGRLRAAYSSGQQRGDIHVDRPGTNVADEVRRARDGLVAMGAEVIVLDLPLAHPGTPELCRALEAHGFFFCGLQPLAFPSGAALLLQYLAVPLDDTQVLTEHPFARALLEYVAAERKRVSSGRAPH